MALPPSQKTNSARRGKVCNRADRVPKHDDVDYQTQGIELVLLALAIPLPQFSALAMKRHPDELVATFTAIELHQDRPACNSPVQRNIGARGCAILKPAQSVRTKHPKLWKCSTRPGDRTRKAPNLLTAAPQKGDILAHGRVPWWGAPTWTT